MRVLSFLLPGGRNAFIEDMYARIHCTSLCDLTVYCLPECLGSSIVSYMVEYVSHENDDNDILAP